MSLHPRLADEIPDDTARVARASFPKGNPYFTLRHNLQGLFQDEQWSDLFPSDGRPATSPSVLALVTLLQFAENLTDRQAADAVRARLDWKYLLGLPLEDPGFDYSLLSDFRSRLLEHGAEARLLDRLLDRFREEGLIKARGRQRTDSTHVLAAIRLLNRIELVGETLRQALGMLARLAPEWVRSWIPPLWHERYGARFEQYRLPKSKADQDALALEIGRDGHRLLEAVYASALADSIKGQGAIEALRVIWVQQYYLEGSPEDSLEDSPEPGRLFLRQMQEQGLPGAEALIQSPYDLEARFSRKRESPWTGYKVHYSESCDPERPPLITHVLTTGAAIPDVNVTRRIHQGLARKDLLPGEHLVDAGYVDAAHLVESRREYDIELIGPVALDTSWQARQGAGFALRDFVVDWEAASVTCPPGHSSTTWSTSQDRYGNAVIHVRFSKATCERCPVRARCTSSSCRSLKLRPRAEHEALEAARLRQQGEAFQQQYRGRAGVEATHAQAVRRSDVRHSRYIGEAKTHLQHVATAAALNLARVAAWFEQRPRATTRLSPVRALAA